MKENFAGGNRFEVGRLKLCGNPRVPAAFGNGRLEAFWHSQISARIRAFRALAVKLLKTATARMVWVALFFKVPIRALLCKESAPCVPVKISVPRSH